ncbi:tol-pal system protein YbgF [Rhodobacteraceae bacterium 2376]|uniref:Cell division coordinator CpoB n=1 Tax=Rhabdonatronobacter sediminivivens TaxID=2743469 RepID=A0A7Z0HXC3_9RHOB|nr:tol-pal system protein YbgF [Rhabdonatronobacter sediminivivens]NYS24033.1 tol-pal system protein YbgF [Rhabdonatronobacter sediminivivens]
MRRGLVILLAVAGVALTTPARADTLADLRVEVERLATDMARLRAELLPGDGSSPPAVDGDTLERIDRIEAALSRLTGQAEELDFRIRQIVRDATNRLGDIEFRLVELEGGDPTQLGTTPPLGGVDLSLPGQTTTPESAPEAEADAPLMAADEQRTFDQAVALLEDGRADEAAEALKAFLEAYPGGPMTEQAQLRLGEAHRARGATGDAARTYLNLFTAAPQGRHAPAALLALGEALAELGETAEACVMFEELSDRFPGSDEEARGREAFARLSCG